MSCVGLAWRRSLADVCGPLNRERCATPSPASRPPAVVASTPIRHKLCPVWCVNPASLCQDSPAPWTQRTARHLGFNHTPRDPGQSTSTSHPSTHHPSIRTYLYNVDSPGGVIHRSHARGRRFPARPQGRPRLRHWPKLVLRDQFRFTATPVRARARVHY